MATPSKNILKSLITYDHYKMLPPEELTILGEAPKFLLKSPSKNKTSKIRFIAKGPKKHGLRETLTEFLINEIGMAIPGLNISESRIGSFNKKVYFLSLFFHSKEERLTHGIELFSKFYKEEELLELKKGKKRKRNIYTIENIIAAIELHYPSQANKIIPKLFEMCLFDALIGNQDRHAKNWGIIESIYRDKPDLTRFSPVFDTARGLAWNLDENRLKKMSTDPTLISKYIEKSTPEISVENDLKANHFELIEQILSDFPESRKNFRNLIQMTKNVNICKLVNGKKIYNEFSPVRKHIIINVYNKRLNILKKLING